MTTPAAPTPSPSDDVARNQALLGRLHRPVNPHAEAPGSIHDDSVAQKLGFQGGTVAGDILMDSFPPLLVEAFGNEWFRSGSLSLYFKKAIQGGDEVRVGIDAIAADAPDPAHRRVFMQTPNGDLICEGTASAGTDSRETALDRRDLRATEPSELDLLAQMSPGEKTPVFELTATREAQKSRKARGYLTEPMDWYEEPGVAAPSTAIGELLYRKPRLHWTPRFGEAVGLFGAIELRHWNGPIRLDESYDVQATVQALGQSPKTEFLWFDSEARNEAGDKVASMRMMLRFMKGSGSLKRSGA